MMPGAYPDQAASPAPEPVYQHVQAHEIYPQHQQPDDSYAQHTAAHPVPPNQPTEYTQHDPRFGGHAHEQSYYTQQQPDSASPHHDSGWQQVDSHDTYLQQPPSAQGQAMFGQAVQADPQADPQAYHSIPSEHDRARWEHQWDGYQQAAPPGQPGPYDIAPSRQGGPPLGHHAHYHRPRRAAFLTNEEGHGYQSRRDDLVSGNDAMVRSGHRPKRHKRQVSDQQQIQVVLPDSRGKDDTARSLSEQMQMMMMNQMMSQQMTAQQMQFAQMNAMLQNTPGSLGGGKDEKMATRRKKKPSVHIKSKQMGRRVTRPLPVVAAAPPAPPVSEPTIESAAMENWQEATIILCIAIVGVIYLVVSRSNKEEEKEASAAAKHLVPKS